MKDLALDTMGIVFETADDIAELLVPFIARQGGCVEASPGQSSAVEFRQQVGITAAISPGIGCKGFDPGDDIEAIAIRLKEFNH